MRFRYLRPPTHFTYAGSRNVAMATCYVVLRTFTFTKNEIHVINYIIRSLFRLKNLKKIAFCIFFYSWSYVKSHVTMCVSKKVYSSISSLEM